MNIPNQSDHQQTINSANTVNGRQLRKTCEIAEINKLPAAESSQIKIIGQERAVKALQFGLGIKANGFNIYVSGYPGTGKLTAVKNFLEEIAKKEPVPLDWCYVNNFKEPNEPQSLSIAAGLAVIFKKDVKSLVQEVQQTLIKVFESEEFARRKKIIVNKFEAEQAKLTTIIAQHAQKESLQIKQTSLGVATIPLKNNKPISDEEYEQMSEKEKEDIERRQGKIMEEINASLEELRKKEKATNDDLERLAKEVAEKTIHNLIKDAVEKYNSSPDVVSYLHSVKDDILDNLNEFMLSQKAQTPSPYEEFDNSFLKRYEVVVLVDNTSQTGAPVIIERNPTYNNLIGRVEKESHMGTLYTDFTMIRKGSLHSANGGYLIIRAEELFANGFAWEGLKRALKNKELEIEEVADQLGYFTTKTLRPRTIPLNVKVILIGNPVYYNLLYQYDSDFKQLFKVKADFDTSMERNEHNINDYIDFVNIVCKKESLLTPSHDALAKIVEYGSRLAEDQEKLTTCFDNLCDVIREANYYAVNEQSQTILSAHITKAIEEKKYRSGLIKQKIDEMIANNQIYIDIKGEKKGQINGLSVIDLGDTAFGMPSRITCSIGLGKEGIIAIEREAEMSGPIHTKGVLILTGYLSEKFIQDKPVSLAARLVFEQNYSGVEGDSASSTELYAIISTLAGLPVKQGIAVTGSVNQKGQVQPIGGVNEKIEGYYEVCKRLGLNGEQGVMIPSSNLRNLMLKEEVLEAVEEGKFRLWAVDTIEQGIEILTGVKAGNINERGTVFYLANSTLNGYADKMKEFAEQEDGILKH